MDPLVIQIRRELNGIARALNGDEDEPGNSGNPALAAYHLGRLQGWLTQVESEVVIRDRTLDDVLGMLAAAYRENPEVLAWVQAQQAERERAARGPML